jgi:ornithine decarboxylase
MHASSRQLFPGTTAYAVKTNGEPMVHPHAGRGGVEVFDVASPAEFAGRAQHRADAELLYMHPVKAQSDIRLALEHYGIRVLVVDHEDEIAKMLRIARALDHRPHDDDDLRAHRHQGPRGLRIVEEVRRGAGDMPSNCCSGCTRSASRPGLCFHVGSQVEEPESYQKALASADWVRNRAGVPLAGLDVGGGFPRSTAMIRKAASPEPLPLEDLMANFDPASGMGVRRHAAGRRAGPRHRRARLLADRAGAAQEGPRLYINDGIWASLSDSWTGKITLPARFIPDPASASARATRRRSCRSRSAARPAIPSTS